MNIEKSIELLKEFKKTGFHTLMIKYNEDRIHTNKLIEEAIETLLTAYEKEKGENVKLRLQDIPLIEGELKAYESVKSMFEGITIKNVTTESKMTLYPIGIMDVLRIIPVIERQEKEIKNYKQEKEEWLELYNDRVSDIINLEQEIKELKSNKDIQIVWGGRRYNTEAMILERYVSKNRIREEIQELEKMKENIDEVDVSRIKFAELILESLLEE